MKSDKEIVINCGYSLNLTSETDLNKFFQRLGKAVIAGK